MVTSVLSMALAAAIGAGPGGYPNGPAAGAQHAAYAGAPVSGGVTPVCYGGSCDGGSCGGGGCCGGGSGGGYGGYGGGAYPGNEPLFPYDSQLPWMHGYFQEMPAYGGFVYYRPFNYKHVMPQAQTAGGWGMSPTMPYSQQFWHRFQQQAAMSPQLSDYRSRPSMPMARSANARPSSPMISRPSENIPASYVLPSDRPPVSRSLPPVAPSPRTAGLPAASGPSLPAAEQSPYQRFSRERSDEESPFRSQGGRE